MFQQSTTIWPLLYVQYTVGYSCLAIKLLKLGNKWRPAFIRGKPVVTDSYVIPYTPGCVEYSLEKTADPMCLEANL